LFLGPNITDRIGNAMNQNGNGVNGEKADTFARIHQDTTSPVFTGVVETRPYRGITIEFSEAIDPATVNKYTVQLVNKATGQIVPLTAIAMTPYGDGRRFDLRFDADLGDYELRILPGVRDLFGNQSAKSIVPFRIALLESTTTDVREIEASANLFDVEKFLAAPDQRLTAFDPIDGTLDGLAYTTDGPLDLAGDHLGRS
jgi:hypothetical protein